MRRSALLVGAALAGGLACAGGPCTPSTGGFSIAGELVQEPLYNPHYHLLVFPSDPICPSQPEGAVRLIAELDEDGALGLEVVEAIPPEAARCVEGFDLELHAFDFDEEPGPGASVETILSWPASDDPSDRAAPLRPPPTTAELVIRRLERIVMPQGHL